MGLAMKFLSSGGFMLVNALLLGFLILYALTQKTVPIESRKSFEHSPGTMANS